MEYIMPYLKVQTNVEVVDGSNLLKKLSSIASSEIGKPETSIMTSFVPVKNMTFGGTEEPAVFIECKSIGLKKDQTVGLSSVLCSFCKKELDVPEDRIYIEFSSAEGAMWGWNGRTF